MKKIIAFVALFAVLAGIVGVIVCILPSQSDPDKIVAKYVDAINDVKVEKMKKYSFSTVASDALGSLMEGDVDDLFSNSDTEPVKDIYGALKKSVFRLEGLPEDIKQVNSVELVGCVDGETETAMNLVGLNVKAILQVEYEDANGETQTLNTSQNLGLILYKNKYYIFG